MVCFTSDSLTVVSASEAFERLVRSSVTVTSLKDILEDPDGFRTWLKGVMRSCYIAEESDSTSMTTVLRVRRTNCTTRKYRAVFEAYFPVPEDDAPFDSYKIEATITSCVSLDTSRGTPRFHRMNGN